MTGLRDLLASERGVFCIVALIAGTVLVVTGDLATASWLDYVKWLTGVLVASKTITSTAETVMLRKAQPVQSAALPASETAASST